MHEYPLITTIAAAFSVAWVLGLITQKLRLSPIVGYLLAGVVIGPFTPGFVGDPSLAPQLAEIGVILLMFGVGLHFKLNDLLAVARVAIPGAVGQTVLSALLGLLIAGVFAFPLKFGLVLGISVAVSSTVVLLRGLIDNKILATSQGHVAVGWTIVEDILTVVLLVLIPAMGGVGVHSPGSPLWPIWAELLVALAKLAAMVAILLWGGSKLIPWLLVRVAKLRSRELFTLTVLVMSIAIAAGSAYLFGMSMALGAFLAGMVVGQSPVSHQAAADALPLSDTFAVLFFTSVGMLFDPRFILHQPALVLAALGIIMLARPVAAIIIVAIIGHPLRTGLTVAMGLAQIGEFSFILAEVARAHGLMNETLHNVIIACAIISITLNPFVLRLIHPIELAIKRSPHLWRLLNQRAERESDKINVHATELIDKSSEPLAVIIGYGVVGRSVDTLLRKDGLSTVIVDLNVETIQLLHAQGRAAIFGNALNIEVMHQTLRLAAHIIITLPESSNLTPLITAAKLINPAIKVFVRARYMSEREELEQAGVDGASFEEAESAVALATIVMSHRGHEPRRIRREATHIRRTLSLGP
jgi:CPA2 family monovalent cation:H+ antiporter-2